ncbi:uncharacterized protein LOC9659506 isoform X3 [Selaginella moellendorffii]|uniref:uncharacterized protein LOC9659506 isoform X3 n=1 Tax=Selaginella moellendorffii TaxID=88036 RepID=UPI000D1CC246|nr:uncharacterized protein LOC9659506 isoform X3 [Selaginella moellendorffii]|eukprot:XP_024530095.1 uncharacterized protein LOC9659506 isoform X3 [Selaginella moellendorffii]
MTMLTLRSVLKQSKVLAKSSYESRRRESLVLSTIPVPQKKKTRTTCFSRLVLGSLSSDSLYHLQSATFFRQQDNGVVASKRLRPQEEEKFKAELQKFEEALKNSPDDLSALEGAAVSYAELGEYAKAQTNLEKLIRMSPSNVEALRLLAEVKSSLNDFEGSSNAYRQAIKASGSTSMELLLGLTEALIDANKPGEAVDELLRAKETTKTAPGVQVLKADDVEDKISSSAPAEDGTSSSSLDPVQIDLLLGKAYSAWNRPTDALTVYDALIKGRPDDFRGYLAKGVLLKEQGQASDAERMFIQARYFAPAKAKYLVDKYTRQ